MAGSYPLPVPQMGSTVGRSSGTVSELRGDLVSSEEVLSCWAGGGRASVVGPGKTAFTCRTP